MSVTNEWVACRQHTPTQDLKERTKNTWAMSVENSEIGRYLRKKEPKKADLPWNNWILLEKSLISRKILGLKRKKWTSISKKWTFYSTHFQKNEHLVQGLFNWFSFINSSFNLTQGPVIGIWFTARYARFISSICNARLG